MIAFIKTFMRPELCKRCVDSIHTHLDIPVVVADDGPETIDYGSDYLIRLPFDSGISAGRNAAVRLASLYDDTLLMFDDDHVVDADSGIKEAAWMLNEYDIVCGAPYPNGFDNPIYHWEWLFTFPAPHCITAVPQPERGAIHAGNNFFLARASVFEDVLWDERLKVSAEHFDFFLSAYFAGKKVFYEPSMRVHHKQDSSVPGYVEYRRRLEEFDAIFREKWQLTDIHATDGTRMP